MNRDFGKELRRPFSVAEECYDCADFFDGCEAWPASKQFACRKYHRLPDVGINGATGQVFPPSRRRTPASPAPEPTGPAATMITKRPTPEGATSDRPTAPEPTARPATGDRTPSPVSRPGSDGKRRCACGTELPKRKRCCESCRRQKREEAVRRWQSQRTAGNAG